MIPDKATRAATKAIRGLRTAPCRHDYEGVPVSFLGKRMSCDACVARAALEAAVPYLTADATRDNLDAKLSVRPSVTSDGLPDDKAAWEAWAKSDASTYPTARAAFLAGRVSGRADALRAEKAEMAKHRAIALADAENHGLELATESAREVADDLRTQLKTARADAAAQADALKSVQAWTHPGLMLDPSHEPAPTVLHWTRPGQLEAKCATCGFALVALDADNNAIRARAAQYREKGTPQ